MNRGCAKGIYNLEGFLGFLVLMIPPMILLFFFSLSERLLGVDSKIQDYVGGIFIRY